jgi:hypothetical protein
MFYNESFFSQKVIIEKTILWFIQIQINALLTPWKTPKVNPKQQTIEE